MVDASEYKKGRSRVSRCGKKCRTLNQPVYPGKRGKSRRKSLRPDEGRVQGLFEADYLSMQKKVWLNAWKATEGLRDRMENVFPLTFKEEFPSGCRNGYSLRLFPRVRAPMPSLEFLVFLLEEHQVIALRQRRLEDLHRQGLLLPLHRPVHEADDPLPSP